MKLIGAFVILSLLFAIVVTVVAETWRDDAELGAAEKTNKVDDEKARCSYGCCGGHGRWGCHRCCPPPAGEVAAMAGTEDNQVVNVEPQDGSVEMNEVDDEKVKCPHGCCLRGRRRCLRCCPPYAGEAAAMTGTEYNELGWR